MTIEVLGAHELGEAHWRAWRAILAATPPWDSPFFQPGFAQEVAAVRPRVEVALLREQGEIVGVFPFERSRGKVGRPVGAGLSEFHGMCVRPGVRWNASEVLRACGLFAWHYDHVPAAQSEWSAGHTLVGESPAADLRDGFPAYVETCRQRGSRTLIEARRKGRKLAREFGALRFEWHSDQRDALDALLTWKAAQHERTGVLDVFRFPWVVQLLTRLQGCRQTGFRGVLSTLRAGNRLAAVHLGLASERVVHWWYPAYDPALAAYSPGLLLLAELLRELPERGFERLDFGPGPQRFKSRLGTLGIPVAMGVADRFPAARELRSGWRALRGWVQRSRLRHPARYASRWLVAWRQRAAWK